MNEHSHTRSELKQSERSVLSDLQSVLIATKYPLLYLVFLAILGVPAQAQVFRYSYGALGNDIAEAVRQTADDGFVVLGTTGSFGNGSSDVYLVKISDDGQFLWSKTFGGSAIDQGMDIRVLPNGDLIIAGYTNTYGAGGYDMYLIRTDDMGNVLWEKTYGGSDWDMAHKVEVYSDGFLLIGDTYSYGEGNSDMYVVRTDLDGDTLWTRTFGGPMVDYGRGLEPLPDGGAILCGGYSFSNIDMDAYFVRLDANGDLVWQNQYGGDSLELARDVVFTNDGGFCGIGTTESASEFSEMYHFKTDGDGNFQWGNNWGQIDDQEGYEMVERADGSFVTGGYTKTSGGGGKDFFMQFITWDGWWIQGRSYGDLQDEEAFSIDTTNTGGFVMAGTTVSVGAGQKDIMVIRKDFEGGPGGKPAIEVFDPLSIEEELAEAGVRVRTYPQPASNGFYFEVALGNNTTLEWQVEMFDALGRPIMSETVKGQEKLWTDTRELSQGTYFYRVTSSGVVLGSGPISVLR